MTGADSDLEACLPAALRGPATKIERISAGLSGAGVYRVETGDRAYVLKVAAPSAPSAPNDAWPRALALQQLASQAGVTPRVIHVDEARRAVVTELVVDRGFPPLFGNPQTRAAALALLGRTLRTLHAVPLPSRYAHEPRDLPAFLATVWGGIPAGFAPAFVGEAVRAMLAEPAPPLDRPLVLAHGDVNPTNLAYDGERVLLLDWDTAGAGDALFDLAAIAMFLRMDEPATLQLLSAYEDRAVTAVPPRFAYGRRFAAVVCGTLFLHLARVTGFAGATDETRASAPELGELYVQMRSGALSVATAAGKWQFGLALIKASGVG